MFSLDNFYNILYSNFFKRFNFVMRYFLEFNLESTKTFNLFLGPETLVKSNFILFYDQEPLYSFVINNIDIEKYYGTIKILANSEISSIKKDILKQYDFVDWYYFFHGFAALEWYRDFQYFPKVEKQFSKVFISLNHLTTKDRSYRLNLISNYIDKNILSQGHVSLHCSNKSVKEEIFNKNSRLSLDAKKFIATKILPLEFPLTLDTVNPNGNMSSKLNLDLEQSALWNVVSETVFYDQRLHLTEKIFKPIVARRPFILVAAPGNLAYLKSYGFQTFDRWIDESYDTITDPDQRIDAITTELQKLCARSMFELQTMHKEMQEILDYNFDHFYGKFKTIIVNEMIDNLESAVVTINNGRQPNNHSRYHYRLEYPKNYLEDTKQRLVK